MVKQCKNYDSLALKQLYENYKALLLGVCLRYVNNISEAEDLLHECFIKIIKNINRFKYIGKGSLIAWMKRIVMNTAISNYNKRKKDALLTEPETLEKIYPDDETNSDFSNGTTDLFDNTSDDKVDYNFIKQVDLSEEEILNALHSLPETARIIFVMHAIDGVKHEEIAIKLGIKVNACRTRLARAKKTLQAKIHEICLEKLSAN